MDPGFAPDEQADSYVPLALLDVGQAFWIPDVDMPLIGALVRVSKARGYAQVYVLDASRESSHEVIDRRTGDMREIRDSGARFSEWSAGTLVIPLEDDMAEAEAVSQVDAKKARLQALKDKAKAKAATGAAPAKAAKVAAPKKEKVVSDCKCGCGTKTGGSFAPGHDARYYGWLKKFVEGKLAWDQLSDVVRADLKTTQKAKAVYAAWAAKHKTGHGAVAAAAE